MLRYQQGARVYELGAENLLAMLETGIASGDMTWTGKALVMELRAVEMALRDLRLRSSVTTDMADATARMAEKVRADLKNIIFAIYFCLDRLFKW